MDYDPELGGAAVNSEQMDKVQTLKSEVDGVKQIMTQNVDRILARGERLDDLMDKSEGLQDGNGKSRLQEAQEDVEEVKGIMLENMNKAEERSGKLVDLEDRADELLRKSKTFEKKSNQVKEKTRWKNKKMKIVLIGVAVVVALVVIGLIIFFTAT
ncbi:vesicle-associated membrane protein 5 isoform X1 [Stigmatopora argus]